MWTGFPCKESEFSRALLTLLFRAEDIRHHNWALPCLTIVQPNLLWQEQHESLAHRILVPDLWQETVKSYTVPQRRNQALTQSQDHLFTQEQVLDLLGAGISSMKRGLAWIMRKGSKGGCAISSGCSSYWMGPASCWLLATPYAYISCIGIAFQLQTLLDWLLLTGLLDLWVLRRMDFACLLLHAKAMRRRTGQKLRKSVTAHISGYCQHWKPHQNPAKSFVGFWILLEAATLRPHSSWVQIMSLSTCSLLAEF